MATRQEIQIAQDLIRFVNIMNDLLDVASWTAREIDGQTGDRFQVNIGIEGSPSRDATVDELKESLEAAGKNVLGYYSMIQAFINKHGENNVNGALTSMGVTMADIQTDMAKMKIEAEKLRDQIGSAQTKADLIPFADSIDGNIPKLTLVRRSWCLGG